jgi:putative ABC transport system substrate-binding protein
MAANLVRENVVLIFAPGSAGSALAAKAATAAIPIVFACAEDPVRSGLVDNLNRPGGNITGVTFFASPLEQKRVELLNELVPAGKRIALLLNPHFADAEVQVREVKAAAQTFGRQVFVVNASNEGDIAPAFAALIHQHADALLVATDPVLFAHREQIVTMAARHRLPAVYNVRQYADAGGLLSYGTNVAEMFHQAGVYVGRILAGDKAADLPVQLPSKYELIVNMKTAKALGLDLSPTLVARADEVIE